MANELKKLIVKEMVSRYRSSNNYLVIGYQGINSLQFDELRKNLRKKKIHLEIAKNSLAAIAFKEIGIAGIVNLLKLPTMPVLRAQIVTGINAPIVGVVSSFNAVLRGLATVFQAISDKKEKSSE